MHVYTGEGKGKTSAAMGLALRAVGHHKCVFIGQFMKAGVSGEVAALAAHGEVRIEQYGCGGWLRPGSDGARHTEAAREGLARSREALASGAHDVVILDEIDVALSCGLLTAVDLIALLDARPRHVELVLTGRWAPRELLERADLVTEMVEIKHYYRQGVVARAGIEY